MEHQDLQALRLTVWLTEPQSGVGYVQDVGDSRSNMKFITEQVLVYSCKSLSKQHLHLSDLPIAMQLWRILRWDSERKFCHGH